MHKISFYQTHLTAILLLIATDSYLADMSAEPERMMTGPHLRCVNKFSMHGLQSEKELSTADTVVSSLRI